MHGETRGLTVSFREASRWIGVGASAIVCGCSFGTVQPVDCTSNLECRDAFGLGSVCGGEGLCETIEMHPRCITGVPAEVTFPIDPTQIHMIGTLFDHSLDTHIGRYQSAQLAVTQANTNGGLDGVKFGILHCSITEDPAIDALTKTEASVELATWLADSVGVPAIIGPAASSDTEAVYNAVAQQFGTLIVSPSATSPSLTPLDGSESSDESPGLLWRTAPPDSFQGIAIAKDMRTNFGEFEVRTHASENVAVIYQLGAYGEGLQETFSAEMLDRYGATTALKPFDSAVGPGERIGEIGTGGFDEVLFISSEATDVAGFLLGAKGIPAFEGMPIFLTDAARNADVLADGADADGLFDQIRGTAPANPAGPVFDTFSASYGFAFGDDPSTLSYTAQAFDAAWLVIYGHAWALYREDRVINGTNIARGLRHVSSGPAVDIVGTKWNEVKDHFSKGESIDVYGASGELDYDPITEETVATIDVWVIGDDDVFTTVDTYVP